MDVIYSVSHSYEVHSIFPWAIPYSLLPLTQEEVPHPIEKRYNILTSPLEMVENTN
ncbi:MAG: hypothetical protein F6K50_04995 [Moorea sp. SIO3I7]|uniref:hypothetical protein n=1 Tax=unclassified Moorena TaxID=2683338 RepID=UPI0013BF9D80|nr:MULTISPECIES: hypothetical protein [unclassified Moorena]NEN94902.1 hypothetical protein [Moorena sp. SIO3I7]NEO07414.1 hypothetical protein [Moorena sp. SIO3I8]NEP23913.1 hypothetical protein [Moorena sp. SIO3I6]